MAKVTVLSADVADGRLRSMEVQLASLPVRKLDRDVVVAWMRQQHSFLTRSGLALQLVEIDVDGDAAWFVRTDNQPEPSDRLDDLGAPRR